MKSSQYLCTPFQGFESKILIEEWEIKLAKLLSI